MMNKEIENIKRLAGIITEEFQHTKYPELYSISEEVAQMVATEINQRVQSVESEMPYKAQYVLEELIRILEAAV